MRLRVSGFTLAAVLSGLGYGMAHPRYESKTLVLETEGGEIEVVKLYGDGHSGTVPARIVVRSNGATRAETDFHRDTSLACSWRRCLIAAADSPFVVVPQHMSLLDGASLRRLDSFGARLLGILVHLWDHLFGYGIALFFLVLPIVAIQGTRIGQRESRQAGCLAMLVAAAAVGTLVLWLYVVVVLSELSMTWALLLGVALFIGMRVARAWRANDALQLTRPAQTMEPRR